MSVVKLGPEIQSKVQRNVDNEIILPFSWDYDDYSVADHWFSLAWSYLNCSNLILSKMIDNEDLCSSFHYALVAGHIFEHSLELFFKGGIIQATKEKPPINHNIQDLFKKFRKLYPDKQFPLKGSFGGLPAPSDKSKKPYGEFGRYPTDKSGNLWKGNYHLDLIKLYKQTCLYKEDFIRLRPLIKRRYPEIISMAVDQSQQ